MTPIKKINDVRENVVFFEDVRAPRGSLVDEPDRGWCYLAEALDFDRIHLFPFGPVKAAADRLLRLVRAAPEAVARLPYWKVLRHRVSELQFEIEVQHLLSMRMLNVAGLYGQVRPGSPRTLDGQDLTTAYEGSLIGTVAGGSNEINRSVIATRGLGLPRGQARGSRRRRQRLGRSRHGPRS